MNAPSYSNPLRETEALRATSHATQSLGETVVPLTILQNNLKTWYDNLGPMLGLICVPVKATRFWTCGDVAWLPFFKHLGTSRHVGPVLLHDHRRSRFGISNHVSLHGTYSIG